jgi:hypothetical protein
VDPKGSQNVNRMNYNCRKVTHTGMMDRDFSVVDTFLLKQVTVTEKAIINFPLKGLNAKCVLLI